MSAIEKTGDWDGFAKLLAEAGSKFRKNIGKATDDNGRLVEGGIVDRINANQVTPATSDEFRKWKADHGYSTTTLLMSTDMMNAVKYERKSFSQGFVGVNRNAESKPKDGSPGVKLASLAAVHEYGRLDGSIPARPFIAPVVARHEKQIVENYQKAVEETFKK